MSLLETAAWTGQIFTGSWESPSGGTRDVLEPATGAILGTIGLAGTTDVRSAAQRADAAWRDWAATAYPIRAAVLRRAADVLEQNRDEIIRWLGREAGTTRALAAHEVSVGVAECHEAAALPGAAYGDLLPSAQPRLSAMRRLPIGVVGVIAPFNFPIILSIRAIAPALALGNAVLLKPDPRTAVSGGVLLAQVFAEAGLPPGLFQVLPGGADIGSAIVADPQVRSVAFTGSTRAGREVASLAGQYLTRVNLELGGNGALIVLPDADIEAAASCGAWGSFLHQGQVCMATGRHLVHESVYEHYVDLLGKRAEQLTVGDAYREDVALGPLIDGGQLGRVHDLVTRSIETGARLVSGGTYERLFYRPTVLADCHSDTPAYAEEVFGPVACVRPFRTDAEAAELAADSEYRLSLGVLTGNLSRGLALADQVPHGMVHINDQTVNGETNAPFGGFGASGNGSRVGGARANIEAFTEPQWLTVRPGAAQFPF